ncbi:unnamed protein product [Dracunculus medinensis]|uniref:CC domain-containing protein n=1 Tax=Dracunculus medinensis TaxID=318479 RepID=A0A0N4U322_DRAME|nr:unnamed protein product [Dracunculus medinensis]
MDKTRTYRMYDLCSTGEVPFLEEITGRARPCSSRVRCPIGYYCNINKICCGTPGTCPGNQKIAIDKAECLDITGFERMINQHGRSGVIKRCKDRDFNL